MMYDFELDKAIEEIKKQDSKKVLLHLPDGLKPHAEEIQKEIKAKTGSEVFIWAGSCYGACDIPIESENIGIDLVLHFGHTKWRFS